MQYNDLFDERLDELGDPLSQLNDVVDWEMFRPLLEVACKRKRPGYDPVLLFKMLIMQRLYNLSDEQLEFQVLDRASFKRFLGLRLSDKVPDARTIWAFRELLVTAGVAGELFNTYRDYLKAQHIITKSGTIVNATFVENRRS